jgi:hypothetical protein
MSNLAQKEKRSVSRSAGEKYLYPFDHLLSPSNPLPMLYLFGNDIPQFP